MSHLRNLGHEIAPVDPHIPGARVAAGNFLSRVSWRLGYPIDYSRVNKQLIDVVRAEQPAIVWVDKGVLVRRRTLMQLKDMVPEVTLVHYNPDDPFGDGGRGGWRTFLSAMRYYDVHFVPRLVNVNEYERQGCRRVYFNIPTRGFDPLIHQRYPSGDPIVQAFTADVGFLGGYEQDRYRYLVALAEAGIKILLMYDWPSHYWHENFRRAPFDARAEDYAKALSGFKVGLGFLRKANRDQHTSRSIEIPACGTFLLAERTKEHQMLFDEGKEAEFFSSADELIDKTRFYCTHDDARETIAQAGHARCRQSGYDYGNRLRQMIEQVRAD